MSDWQIKSSTIVYETPWMKVHRDEVLNHKGKALTYSYVELQQPSVFIVATNDKNEILLQQNYRFTVDKTMWEVPAGYGDKNDQLTAAKRELLEETGLESEDWTELGTLYQANGIGNIPFTVFLARNTYQAKPSSEEDEQIGQQRFISMDKINTMIDRGEIIESAHISALYLSQLHYTKERKS